MKILELNADNNLLGKTELEETIYEVDLSLTEGVKVGDYVIVHAGFAIEKLDREEADERLKLFEEMAAMQQSDSDTP